ncbi:hypothetical protein HYH02_013681 [Chlamydomonas schloesseri]|uniref:Uncharacterized protein n=1 Tax=Chlamydomonas schloesseri TaxID=2026947 RepID=A0A835SYR1_9CHLO|nr:hypothetical protein HYH02_013681 [Chlamydomonas schloesseri]|eukprot:KAG2430684.1 hypothetical protein HYH02_013681 [Chlamydomonas schloesseri]
MALGRHCHSGTVHLRRTGVTAFPRARRTVSQRSIHAAATPAEKAFSARDSLVRSDFSTIQAEGLLVVFPTNDVSSKQDIKDLDTTIKDLRATLQQSIKDLQKDLQTTQEKGIKDLETKQQQAATAQQQAITDLETKQQQAVKDLQTTLNQYAIGLAVLILLSAGSPLATTLTFLSKLLPLVKPL